MDLSQGSHGWGRYVIYVMWLQDTHGADQACRVLRTLEVRHPESIPPIWILLARWTASQLCSETKTHPQQWRWWWRCRWWRRWCEHLHGSPDARVPEQRGAVHPHARSHAERSFGIITGSIGVYFASSRLTTVSYPSCLSVSYVRPMGSRPGGDATSEMMESRDAVFTDGDRRLIQVCMGGALKSKTGKAVAATFERILRRSGGRRPHRLQTDKGKKIYNATFAKMLEHYGICHFSTQGDATASVVERFNRTLKGWMYRYFTAQDIQD